MMTPEQKEVVTLAISDQELERRWSAVRERMKEEKIEVLVMQDTNEWLGGYVKWFSDIPARNGYPMTVIFFVDAQMTTITCGGKPPGDLGPPAWTMRGVDNRLTAPYFPSLNYSNTYDAELTVQTLKSKKKSKIGIMGKGRISVAFYEHLIKGMPGATFVDATDVVDEIKAVKSSEEIELIKKACALQDQAMEWATTIIKPGRKDFEIVADVVHKVTMLGSEEQLVIAGSGPLGRPAPMQKRHFQGRTLRENESFTLMIEVNGPGGMYAELGRIFFTGDVPVELSDAYELCREAQQVTLKLLKPGANPKDIWDANNEFLVKHGMLPETRLYAHGQGYDLVERPSFQIGERMKIQENMNIAVHPVVASKKATAILCDNYIVTRTGVSECLHKIPKEIFVV